MGRRTYFAREFDLAPVEAEHPRAQEFAWEVVTTEEGFRLRAYQDAGGVWTVGWGRTGPDVGPDTVTTMPQETPWLRARLLAEARALQDWVPTLRLPSACWAALISWRYNVGGGAADRSRLRRLLVDGRLDEVDDELLRWVHRRGPDGKKVVDPVLVARRRSESELWVHAMGVAVGKACCGVPEDVEREPIAPPDDRVTATDTVRGSTAATTATAIGGSVAAVAPQLWGLDWRVAVAIVLVVALAALAGVVVWRARRA